MTLLPITNAMFFRNLKIEKKPINNKKPTVDFILVSDELKAMILLDERRKREFMERFEKLFKI